MFLNEFVTKRYITCLPHPINFAALPCGTKTFRFLSFQQQIVLITVLQKLPDSKRIIKSHSKCSVSYIGSNTGTKSFVPLVNCLVDDFLLGTGPHFNQMLLQLYDITYQHLVNALLHDAPNLVVNWIQVRTVCQPQV